jgi:hypothetical protein
MHSVDRRRGRRYPVQLNVSYRTVGTEASVCGIGRTVNMDSRGVLISTASPLREGTHLTLEIAWPVLLNSALPLKLVVSGDVIRLEEQRVAIHFENWEFRTTGVRGKRVTVA